MKEILVLLHDRGYDVAVSSLGYLLNLRTGKALYASRAVGQVNLPLVGGGGTEFVQVRTLLADVWGISKANEYVWHLDNNPWNHARDNLAATPKRSHKKTAVNKVLRLADKEGTIEEMEKVSELGEEFIELLLVHYRYGRAIPYAYKMSNVWVQERLWHVNELLVDGGNKTIVLELVEDWKQADLEGKLTVESMEVS